MENEMDIKIDQNEDFSTNALKMKKSYRTTFRLHENIPNIMEKLCAIHNITQKDLIDVCVESFDTSPVLQQGLKEEIEREKVEGKINYQHVRKTVVISKMALDKLKELTKQYNTSRDNILRIGILFLNLVMEKHVKLYNKALKLVIDLKDQIEDTEYEVGNIIGDKDEPVVQHLHVLKGMTEDLMFKIEDFINAGTPIEGP